MRMSEWMDSMESYYKAVKKSVFVVSTIKSSKLKFNIYLFSTDSDFSWL